MYERQKPKKGPQSQPLASDQPMTLREAMQTMAKLGGFLGRKSDGDPGVKTLWRGYRASQSIVLGMQLAESKSEPLGISLALRQHDGVLIDVV